MAITYSFRIRTLNRTTVYGIPDIISHVHFDYIGTDENGKTAVCQGTVPFTLKPIIIDDKASNRTRTIPAVFNKDNYVPYDQITDDIILDWLNASVPPGAVSIFQEIINEQLTN